MTDTLDYAPTNSDARNRRLGRIKRLLISGAVGLTTFVGITSTFVSPSELSYLVKTSSVGRSNIIEDSYVKLVEKKDACTSGSERNSFLESLDDVFSRRNLIPLYEPLALSGLVSLSAGVLSYNLITRKK